MPNFVTVITWLLQHNPNDRPTALELSQSSLLPPRMEDEYFKSALKMMGSYIVFSSISCSNLLTFS